MYQRQCRPPSVALPAPPSAGQPSVFIPQSWTPQPSILMAPPSPGQPSVFIPQSWTPQPFRSMAPPSAGQTSVFIAPSWTPQLSRSMAPPSVGQPSVLIAPSWTPQPSRSMAPPSAGQPSVFIAPPSAPQSSTSIAPPSVPQSTRSMAPPSARQPSMLIAPSWTPQPSRSMAPPLARQPSILIAPPKSSNSFSMIGFDDSLEYDFNKRAQDTSNTNWEITVKRLDHKTVTEKVTVPRDCRVSELIEKVSQVFTYLDPEDVILTKSEKDLPLTVGKCDVNQAVLSTFKITDKSTLILKINRKPLTAIPGVISITTDPNEPDMASYDDSPDHPRAKMPCGHFIGSESMITYCYAQIKKRALQFHCTYYMGNNHTCEAEWPFNLVRHVCCFTKRELEEVESVMAKSAMKTAPGIQECPGCKNWCFRDNVSSNRVVCKFCTKQRGDGKPFEFCWQCVNIWNGTNTCENKDCNIKDPRIDTLATCPDKEIVGVKMPSIRGCPKCGTLIEHKVKCKHMECTTCSWSFCFLCLEGMKDGRWQCAYSNSACGVKPRQTWLPNNKNERIPIAAGGDERDGEVEVFWNSDSDRDSDRDNIRYSDYDTD